MIRRLDTVKCPDRIEMASGTAFISPGPRSVPKVPTPGSSSVRRTSKSASSLPFSIRYFSPQPESTSEVPRVLLALPGPALAGVWSPGPKIRLFEYTGLTLTDRNVVQVHLTIDVCWDGFRGNGVTVNVLVPSDAELVAARWKPRWEPGKKGEEIGVEPVAVKTVTWPGSADEIKRQTCLGEYDGAFDALFPDGGDPMARADLRPPR
ncbi:hypothetical protein [Methanopyrus kandleri]